MANAQRVLSRRAASHISRRYSALVLVVSALLGGVASQMAYAQVDCGTADAERVSCAEVGNTSTGWAGWWQSFSSGTAANKAVETVTYTHASHKCTLGLSSGCQVRFSPLFVARDLRACNANESPSCWWSPLAHKAIESHNEHWNWA